MQAHSRILCGINGFPRINVFAADPRFGFCPLRKERLGTSLICLFMISNDTHKMIDHQSERFQLLQQSAFCSCQ